MIALLERSTPAARPPPTIDHPSYSAISLYRQCPLRYFFRYVEQLPERRVSSSLVFGAAIHAAIELLHYHELLVSGESPDLPALLSAYRAEWEQRNNVEVVFTKDDDADSLLRLAERMLLAFQASEASQPQGAILGIEEELRGKIVPDAPDLVARIDLVERVDNRLVVTDFKTARSPWSEAQAEDSSEQLLLYGQLVGRLLPCQELALQFVIVTKAKNRSCKRAPSQTTHVAWLARAGSSSASGRPFRPATSIRSLPR